MAIQETVLSQHMTALEKANRVRLGRAELKRQVRSGEMTVAEALVHELTETMPVAALLCSQWRWQETRACKLLSFLGISEQKLCGTLTERQRAKLLVYITLPPSKW